jgi:thioredoxin 1
MTAILMLTWLILTNPPWSISGRSGAVPAKYADKLSVVKLNVDESPNVAAKFGIRSIPTLMIFKDGAVQAQKVGAFSKSQLTDFLDSNL